MNEAKDEGVSGCLFVLYFIIFGECRWHGNRNYSTDSCKLRIKRKKRNEKVNVENLSCKIASIPIKHTANDSERSFLSTKWCENRDENEICHKMYQPNIQLLINDMVNDSVSLVTIKSIARMAIKILFMRIVWIMFASLRGAFIDVPVIHSMRCLEIYKKKKKTRTHCFQHVGNAWQMSVVRLERVFSSSSFSKPQFNLCKTVSYPCHLIVFCLNRMLLSFNGYLDDASKVLHHESKIRQICILFVCCACGRCIFSDLEWNVHR